MLCFEKNNSSKASLARDNSIRFAAGMPANKWNNNARSNTDSMHQNHIMGKPNEHLLAIYLTFQSN